MRNGKPEVRNGNEEHLHPISYMASEKWEMGLKWESPFFKCPPHLSTLRRGVKIMNQLQLLIPFMHFAIPQTLQNNATNLPLQQSIVDGPLAQVSLPQISVPSQSV